MKISAYKAAGVLIALAAFSFKLKAQDKAYFQQEVNYKINVQLNDQLHSLDGFIELEYINNSPEELSFIYMHLWPNAYKNNKTALAKQLLENDDTSLFYSEPEERGFIDNLNFKVDNSEVKWSYHKEHEDIAIIFLSSPLPPGQRIVISTPFFVKIPSGKISRLGHIGQQYQITQWYPKPAVYDRFGWHPMPYLTQGEFYSEFGSFTVSITLPSNYVVGATGDLVNGEDEKKWLDIKARQTEAMTKFPSDLSFPVSSAEYKTLTFYQTNVHDFAWFADKRYHVLRGEVELPYSKKKVELWAMFTNSEADLWKKSIQYLHDATYYYSLWNGDYPYNHVTAVDGALSAGAGMEYPNITVIGTSGNAFALENVIVHEVGHNWFYGILASNERQHPWMDEGINSFIELRYNRLKHPNAGILGLQKESSIAKAFDLDYPQRKQYELMYLLSARQNLDQPIELPAPQYTELNYGAIVYSKTAIAFDYLREYLGTPLFDKAMQTYYERWKFKHPYPKDLKDIFEEVTAKDLSWFFNDLINTTEKLNYKIRSVKKQNCYGSDCFKVKLKNKGGIAGPVSISALKEEEIIETVWLEGFEKTKQITLYNSNAQLIRIDAAGVIPEINKRNGFARTTGLFKTLNPIDFQFLGSIEHPDKNQIFYTPVIGWNNYNKLMPGMAFYNSIIPQKNFEYLIMPMFSIGTKREAGIINLNKNLHLGENFIRQMRIGLNAEKFAVGTNIFDRHYHKLEPKIVIDFQKENPRSPQNKSLILRMVNIWEDQITPEFQSGNFTGFSKGTINYSIFEAQANQEFIRAVNPAKISASVQYHDSFIRTSFTANYRLTYPKKKKGIDLRFFAGRFLINKEANPRFFFGMAGNTDYTYDHVFLDRNRTDPLLGRQFPLNDGGFKNPVTLNFSDNWLSAVNLKVPLPGRIPLSLYGDLGFTSYRNINQVYSAYNAGVALVVVRDIFEIYFPVAMSSNLNQLTYLQKVRFILNLNQLNPLTFIRNFQP
jgi:hypothetical protein